MRQASFQQGEPGNEAGLIPAGTRPVVWLANNYCFPCSQYFIITVLL